MMHQDAYLFAIDPNEEKIRAGYMFRPCNKVYVLKNNNQEAAPKEWVEKALTVFERFRQNLSYFIKEFEVYDVDFSDFINVISVVSDIIEREKEKNNLVYVNVSTGTDPVQIGMYQAASLKRGIPIIVVNPVKRVVKVLPLTPMTPPPEKAIEIAEKIYDIGGYGQGDPKPVALKQLEVIGEKKSLIHYYVTQYLERAGYVRIERRGRDMKVLLTYEGIVLARLADDYISALKGETIQVGGRLEVPEITV